MYGDSSNLYSYFRPTPDQDRILLGSRGFDKHELSERTEKYLKRKLTQIFPELFDCKIECPLHGAEFDLKTGEAVTLPATKPEK